MGSRVQNLGCEIQSSGIMENQVESTLKHDKEMGIWSGSLGLRRGLVLLRDPSKKGVAIGMIGRFGRFWGSP